MTAERYTTEQVLAFLDTEKLGDEYFLGEEVGDQEVFMEGSGEEFDDLEEMEIGEGEVFFVFCCCFFKFHLFIEREVHFMPRTSTENGHIMVLWRLWGVALSSWS